MPADDVPSYARLPLSYSECRARLERAAIIAGQPIHRHPLTAAGPSGEELSIDTVLLGDADAPRLLVLLSGVHGVEGFLGSALQCDLLERQAMASIGPGVGVLLVHAVNPWGMAWWRRENESNVDLNRNWRRSAREPAPNDAYDELHHLACPDTDEMPDASALLGIVNQLVAERGLDWVRNGITAGQYSHPDGLHYGGDRTEESNLVLERIVEEHVVGRERVLVVDLHTGHGRPGAVTLLTDQPPSSAQHRFFTGRFPETTVEATVDNPDATTGLKSGQIANGIRALFPEGHCWSTSAEFGTTSDLEQLSATYVSRWVRFHGDPADPRHAAALWRYRCCFTPDDRTWEAHTFRSGRTLIDHALAATGDFDRDPLL